MPHRRAAYSARVKVAIVTSNETLAAAIADPTNGAVSALLLDIKTSIASLAGVSIDTVVPFCASEDCLKGAVDSDIGGAYKITEHLFGFKDGEIVTAGEFFQEKKSGTQLAYEFQSLSGNLASRAANLGAISTYLPNGITRKTENWLNTCPSSEATEVCSGRGQCQAARGGLNRCSCYYGFQSDDCSEGMLVVSLLVYSACE